MKIGSYTNGLNRNTYYVKVAKFFYICGTNKHIEMFSFDRASTGWASITFLKFWGQRINKLPSRVMDHIYDSSSSI